MDWGFIFERTISTMFGVEVMVFALAAIGLNVHFGYTGLLNFGQVGFMAAGAYGLGVRERGRTSQRTHRLARYGPKGA